MQGAKVGHDLISQSRNRGTTWETHYYGYEGHGSVRYLTDEGGAVTDTYQYDAFGTLLRRTGTTNNNYLYTGEQYDTDLAIAAMQSSKKASNSIAR